MDIEALKPTIDKTCGHGSCKNAGTYTMPGLCTNCGRQYQVTMTRGHEKPTGFFGARCPNCGCASVSC